MNVYLILANILTLAAFVVHTFSGDRELRLIEPETDENDPIKQEKWTMGRCGWHWVSVDLFVLTLVLGLINFTDIIGAGQIVLQVLAVYTFLLAIVWIITISISKSFDKKYLKLGQWIFLIVISLLMYAGSF